MAGVNVPRGTFHNGPAIGPFANERNMEERIIIEAGDVQKNLGSDILDYDWFGTMIITAYSKGREYIDIFAIVNIYCIYRVNRFLVIGL